MTMKELRELALAYRKAPINNIEAVLREFFEEMDPQKKGFIAFKEFSVYMENLGRPELCSEEFFSKLNQDGSGKLDDMDVVTLFYIVYSRLPFCNSGKKFIEGTSYLVCVKCFHENNRGKSDAKNNKGKSDANEESFNVCTTCYLDEKFKHHHNEFLDPNLLLRHLRKTQPVAVSSTTSAPQDVQDLKLAADNTSNPSANNQLKPGSSAQSINQTVAGSSTQLANLVLAPHRPQKCSIVTGFIVALELALSVGNFVGCSIM